MKTLSLFLTVVAGLEIIVDCCAQPVNSNAAMAVRKRERVFILGINFWSLSPY